MNKFVSKNDVRSYSSAKIVIASVVVNFLLIIAFALEAEPIRAEFRDLGTFGGAFSFAYDINDRGDVVGRATLNEGPNRDWNAFVYLTRPGYGLPLGQLVSLGTVEGGWLAEGSSITEAGEVVGWGYDLNARIVDVRWDLKSSLVGQRSINAYQSRMSAIAKQKYSVGWLQNQSDGNTEAFVQSWGGRVKPIGSLFGYRLSAAYGINDFGSVVGYSWNFPELNQKAFIWTNADGLKALQSSSSICCESVALKINNRGNIIGSVSTGSSIYDSTHPVVWENSDEAPMDLGTLGGSKAWTSDINNRGEIVGRSVTPSGVNHGFLWKDGRMMDLNELLVELQGRNLVQLPQGFAYIEAAQAINNAKRRQIVGYYEGEDQNGPFIHAFLLTLSEGFLERL